MRWLIAAVLAATLAPGCTSEQALDGPVGITITLDDDRLDVGERVNVSVTVENRGLTAYPYEHPGCPVDVVRVTVTGQGQQVRLYAYGEEPLGSTCAVRSAEVPAGTSFTTVVHWNGRSTPNAPEAHAGGRVAPAAYTVTAELARSDGGNTFATSQGIVVRG